MNFNLNEVGATPTKSAYDNESAVKEMLSRMEKQERFKSVTFFIDRDNYPAMGIETNKAMRFKVLVNQSILTVCMSYLTGLTVEPTTVKADGIAKYNEEVAFDFEIFKLLVDNGYNVQVMPLFNSNNKVFAVFSFSKGQIVFRLNRTEEVLDFIADHNLL